MEWQLQKATNEVLEGTSVESQAASLHLLCKNSYIFSRHVCDMIDDPTNQHSQTQYLQYGCFIESRCSKHLQNELPMH